MPRRVRTYIKEDGKTKRKDLTPEERSRHTLAGLSERRRYLQALPEEHRRQARATELKHIYYDTSKFGQGNGFSAVAEGLYRHALKNNVWLDPTNCGQNVVFKYTKPRRIKELKQQNGYVVTYTMFESDLPPYEWKPELQAADEVIVPTRWARDVFYARYEIDAHVIPHGVDTENFYYLERGEHEVCTFLHYDAFKWRKGWDLVYKAFREEFGDEEPVKLIFKTTLDNVLAFNWYRKTDIIKENLDPDELRELHRRADVFVFPSRGEGFGNTPLEAMCTGLPAIAPDEHGLSEYFDGRYMYRLNCEPRRARYDEYPKTRDMGNFQEAKLNSLRQQMRKAFEHWKEGSLTPEYRKEISAYARRWDYSKAAQQITQILKKYGA